MHDSERYMRDCSRAFGSYMHHLPEYGQKWETHRPSYERALRLYEEMYGEEFIITPVD